MDLEFKYELVPQVVESNVDEFLAPEGSVGFIYLWTNLTTGEWYLGKRNGPTKSGYLFSSKQDRFLSDFVNPKYKWSYNIMTYVTTNVNDLTNLESDMLTEKDAKNDPMSYNKSNGIRVNTGEPNLKKVLLLASRIINLEFPIREKVQIKDLMQMIENGERVQSRRKDNYDKIKEIAEFINDAGGITDPTPEKGIVGCDPVVILHNTVFNGKFYEELIVDGSTTTQGASKADKAVYLRVQDVPAEETADFTDGELVMLGNALNPPLKKRKTPNTKDEFYDHVLQSYYKGLDVKSEVNIQTGKQIHGLSTQAINRVLKDVINDVAKKKRWAASGETFCDYDTPAYKDRLVKAVRKANSLHGVYCIDAKTSYYKVDKTLQVLKDLLIQKEEDPSFVCDELRVMLWHKDPETEEYWNEHNRNNREAENKYVFNKTGIRVTFKYMPTWDSSEQDSESTLPV